MTRYLLAFAFGFSSAACATILDFQDATDRPASTDRDASSTATVQEAPVSVDAGSSSTVIEPKIENGLPNVCVCTPNVASDWQGPFAVGGDSCTGNYPVEAYFGLAGSKAPDAKCTCSCEKPSGVTCSTPPTTLFGDKACTQTCQTVTENLDCVGVTMYSCDAFSITKPKAVQIGPSTATGGTCAPSATVEIEPVAWAESMRLCASPNVGAACDGGTCALDPNVNRCVMKAGQNECPSGYPKRHLFHESGDDTRACTACTCGLPAGVDCPVSASASNGTSCSGGATALAAPSACVEVGASTRLTVNPATPQGGACSPLGGVATGAFDEDAPTTVCCVQ